jgi:hypothetical protein
MFSQNNNDVDNSNNNNHITNENKVEIIPKHKYMLNLELFKLLNRMSLSKPLSDLATIKSYAF